MSKVIEISDSEEESERIESDPLGNASSILTTPNNVCNTKDSYLQEVLPRETIPSCSNSPPPLVISDVSSLNILQGPTTATIQSNPSASTSAASTTAAASTLNAALPLQTKRSRRKSIHHPLCASPEIQFETISLDDEEDKAPSKTKNKTNAISDSIQQNKAPKLQKIAPKILNTKPQADKNKDDLPDVCAEFLASDETKALLQQIAEDRVRINFLLASYNMPEIQFALHTKPDVLQFQLEERIKHRKRRSLESSKQMKKRRSLLQTNTRTDT
ncbi:uncharacterized protein LOC120768091 [Bactrocera tryoni]|uniref:uncharacterized protein LOC120768091 n=1 Tax=Bactrocera tryoni TaxID=59916 RepID=UPI001A95D341|nr:uncharacterized protein LOC120768091 [Bactrocera tryoni]